METNIKKKWSLIRLRSLEELSGEFLHVRYVPTNLQDLVVLFSICKVKGINLERKEERKTIFYEFDIEY